jgi:hypothetical protein
VRIGVVADVVAGIEPLSHYGGAAITLTLYVVLAFIDEDGGRNVFRL